jgi:AcrR family transcriptional regulator
MLCHMTTEMGRRERKKQLTRQAISDLATDLFMARGFDAVTVAEVAAAADVAVQTVFNHFRTKEDLFFDQSGWWTGPAQAVRDTPTGESVVAALRQHYLTEIRSRYDAGYLATWANFRRTIEGSPALLARRSRNAQEMEDLLVVALRERDEQLPELTAHLIAAQYAAAQKVLEAELARMLPQDASEAESAKVAASMERAIDEVFGVLSRGLARS